MSEEKPARTDAARRSRQCERLARLLRTLQLISGRGRWDAKSLAEELECSIRTVYRVLETLSAAGVPWYFDDQTRAYRLRPGYRSPLINKADADATVLEHAEHQVREAAEELVERGRLFAETLDRFLSDCEKLTAIRRRSARK